MPRPAPWRLDLSRYPDLEEVQTRFQDLDPMGHLNNVAFAAMFEHARVRYNQRLGQMNLSCAQCHDRSWGRTLYNEKVSQGHPTGWPGSTRCWTRRPPLCERPSSWPFSTGCFVRPGLIPALIPAESGPPRRSRAAAR